VATNLASDLAGLGDTKAAMELGLDTWQRLRRLLDDDHPLTVGCAANYRLDCEAEGDEETAARLDDEIKHLYVNTIGLDHPDAKAAVMDRRRLDFDFDPPPV
jgi:hypothetical protein